MSVTLTQARPVVEEGTSVEEMPQSDPDPAAGIYTINDQWGRAQHMVGGAILGMLVLGSVRK